VKVHSQLLLPTQLDSTLFHLNLANVPSSIPVLFSNLKDKNRIYTMAYLLANATRVRMSREHDRHVWWFTKEEYLEVLRTDKRTEKQEEYAWIMRRPDSINHKFDPNCSQCEAQRQHRDEMKRHASEESEKWRIRQEEEKVRQKERDREAAERRMMAAEDKPKTPPVKVKADPKEMDEWRKLKEEEEALLVQVARVRARANRLNPSNTTTDNTNGCSVCGVTYYSSSDALDSNKRKLHLATRKHQVNAGLIEKEVYPRHCDTCDYDAKTKHAWEQHCEGKKHQARSTQTITIPTTQDVEKKQGIEDPPSAISPEDIVESS
jgi:hypothetical protein